MNVDKMMFYLSLSKSIEIVNSLLGENAKTANRININGTVYDLDKAKDKMVELLKETLSDFEVAEDTEKSE